MTIHLEPRTWYYASCDKCGRHLQSFPPKVLNPHAGTGFSTEASLKNTLDLSKWEYRKSPMGYVVLTCNYCKEKPETNSSVIKAYKAKLMEEKYKKRQVSK